MKPNILLITADQWRGDCLSALGHPVVKTPHVDALAASGTIFSRHYAAAAPCAPARASIYTGLYQMNHRVCRNGSPLDARLDTIALAARRAGYDPTLFGYTDVAPDPRSRHANDPHLTSYEGILPGFTVGQLLLEDDRQWLSWLANRRGGDRPDRNLHLTGTARPVQPNRDAPAYNADETPTAFLTDAFLSWREEQTVPWFAHISFLRPHPPFCVPEPYNRMFDASTAPRPVRHATLAEEMAVHPLAALLLPTIPQSSFLYGAKGRVVDWSPEEIDTIRSIYYGMIAEVDAQFGRIVAALKHSGDWDRTVIVFTSDHAEMMGDHWMMGKGGVYDGSYHIPLVIRDPAIAGGGRVDAFTSAADVMPTLTERMGISPLNHQDGRSLLPFVENKTPAHWRDHAFFEFDFRDVVTNKPEQALGLASRQCNLAVLRDAAFKYVHMAGLPPLLFDLGKDPGELTNVADDPAYLSVRLAYAEKLLTLRAEHLDQTLAYTELTEQGPVSQPKQ
ncbi:alkaline phosphatase family protein [Allorhizobium sp. BGMRC 0089]|uniref:alkaline phosphatase family protein n=1 Tax=Allorhizobium sonneratiae TaxID=2934936 RepID=UPI00203459C3|nr:alkaline phosphatase family protein [Allorhizobium sonneratiae]MCM2291667.1 alkaline phosphatase family protein [Allorhizobium sonneratiae]